MIVAACRCIPKADTVNGRGAPSSAAGARCGPDLPQAAIDGLLMQLIAPSESCTGGSGDCPYVGHIP
ncbi:hypothetical protein SAMN02745121_08958 [Nannocystis exedens]|uniref:Uncharacterized protein n=1 Tax=Nannocystis exedens TaxID=54 RepID=A0A1I2IXN4_9BACT|nr:hypothetical protein NAEX_00228 [Nannocystis exedens]SFF45446.1 hypothetical protein SAMN02745121_08958 [Nannocystis exedens]